MAAAHTEENTNGENFEYRGRGISDQGCGS